jgi:hypothetical protein
VVHDEDGDVLLGGEPQQLGTQQRPGRQVEGAARGLVDEPPRLGLPLLPR